LNKKIELGQVFTSEYLSKFMINLFSDEITENSRILDPSMGPNTFLKYFDKSTINPELVSIEIDNSLITSDISQFYDKENRALIIGNFFDLPLSEKFDFIIENPPYVRQELLLDDNSKEKILNSIKLKEKIPSQSNLYVYFLIKSILHLRENGKLIAVVYDSWLYSSFGKFLKDFLIKNGIIKSIYHIKNNSFDDALIGATVIEFVKTSSYNENKIKYFELNNLNILNAKVKLIDSEKLKTYNFNESEIISLEHKIFTTLEELSEKTIHRGISSLANGYFLFDNKKLLEAIPIIKNIAKIKSYSIIDEFSYILDLNKDISVNTKLYLDDISNKILLTKGKYKALKESIKINSNWYKIKFKDSGNIIFNYYIRNNIDFILNKSNTYCSDNFYSLQIDEKIYVNFAILNSIFSKLSILIHSRNQGNGLRKVQLYEFKKVPIIDHKKLTKNVIPKLEVLGIQLSNSIRCDFHKNEIIKKIDLLLINEYNKFTNENISIKDLMNDIKRFINKKGNNDYTMV